MGRWAPQTACRSSVSRLSALSVMMLAKLPCPRAAAVVHELTRASGARYDACVLHVVGVDLGAEVGAVLGAEVVGSDLKSMRKHTHTHTHAQN